MLTVKITYMSSATTIKENNPISNPVSNTGSPVTSSEEQNYSLRHNHVVPYLPVTWTVKVNTSHSARWSQNSFSWSLMLLSRGEKDKGPDQVERTDLKIESWPLLLHIPTVMFTESSDSSLAQRVSTNDWGLDQERIQEPQPNILSQRSSYTCTLPPTSYSPSLFLRPRTYLILQFLLMKAVIIIM